MKFNISMAILLLAFLIDVEGAIANDKISLVGMVPAAWIEAIKAWDKFLLFCGTSLIGLLAAPGAFTKRVAGAAAAVLVAFALLTATVSTAHAADVVTTTATTSAAVTPATQNNCLINSCTGWYAGVGLTGNGTNADILGSGLNGSVFAAGGMLDMHGGYQLWNGTYFAAVEAGLGYQFQNGAIAVTTNNLTGYEIVKFGGNLSGLVNNASSPIAIPSSLSNVLMSPYFAMGAIQRDGVSQWATGAGAAFLLATNWDLDIRYLYAPAAGNVGSDNLVTIGLNKHF
ncbi:hypothetical protein [Bradyrhizobium erythrophlei]|uniref:Outer membrane protein beta-barrel domain-containing protein n=1 Tax=Bradyrhizobium erythrophlei TaxID=1437360 RepID=A0A1M5NSN7_9BRAD|nr:hypothetical protein [Bradyrhizobium erythrophlei]SHG92566.1 hypothetical protein SAMN05443248_3102 [Bradyrhizobium erythrophlei]